MVKSNGMALIEFGKCSLSCTFCGHRLTGSNDIPFMDILEYVADPKIEVVHLGGMEPTAYGGQLIDLLERLALMKKRVSLKTCGAFPDIIQRTFGLVANYVLEFNHSLNDARGCSKMIGVDIETAASHLKRLQETLELLQDHRMTISMRAIPGYVEVEKMRIVASQLEGKVEKVVLKQYLFDKRSDAPFDDYETPTPNEEQLVIMGRELLRTVPQVSIIGDGFSNDFRSDR